MTTAPLITVVCTANICRSPMGQAVVFAKARKAGLNLTVNSCGVQAITGRRPDGQALSALARAGYSLSNDLGEEKRAQQLLMPQANAANLILVMENRHKQWVMQNFPAYSGKVWLLGHWAGLKEVEDPINQGPEQFDECLSIIEQYVDSWLPKLKAIL